MTPPSLIALFFCFLKIGCVSFGGFMSLVSMIETQVVERRKWMAEEDMLDGVALASLLPGPMAVNTVAYVGYRLRGGLGALVGATAVLLPTFIFMAVLTHFYFRYGSLPEVERVFSGILPAVAAIVLSVCVKMAGKNIKTPSAWAAFVGAVVVLFLVPKASRVYATFGLVAVYGIAGYLIWLISGKKTPDAAGGGTAAGAAALKRAMTPGRIVLCITLVLIVLLGLVPLPVKPDGYVSLMTTFGSMSLTLFGGGYVFIPMIQDVVVERYAWLTAREFIDGIALGQVTPGPILISAAFIGQKVAGVVGGLLSTIAIFAPPAALMVLMAGMLDQIKTSMAVQAVLKGIRIAVIGLIFRAFLNIFMLAWPAEGTDSLVSVIMVLAVSAGSFVALSKFKVDIIWVIPLSGIIGFIFG
ncbi:chromate efflux transporter [Pontiellaceae bacterium B12227]|nr:chromate efflux transporter [Pontiellaceae bacterium B12227]